MLQGKQGQSSIQCLSAYYVDMGKTLDIVEFECIVDGVYPVSNANNVTCCSPFNERVGKKNHILSPDCVFVTIP